MKEDIHAAIVKALATLNIEGIGFVVDQPTDKNTEADLFSNVAMVAAGILGTAPRTVAAVWPVRTGGDAGRHPGGLGGRWPV